MDLVIILHPLESRIEFSVRVKAAETAICRSTHACAGCIMRQNQDAYENEPP